jgi:hypothetical protein
LDPAIGWGGPVESSAGRAQRKPHHPKTVGLGLRVLAILAETGLNAFTVTRSTEVCNSVKERLQADADSDLTDLIGPN